MRIELEKELSTPAHTRWLNAIILDFKDYSFTRRELDQMGVGLHTIAAARLGRIVKKRGWSLTDVYDMGLEGFLDYDGIGTVSAVVVSHLIAAAEDDAQEDFDVFKWIGAKGRTFRGAINQAKSHTRKQNRAAGNRRAR